MEFDVTIEIPKGSRNKYEIDHETGVVMLLYLQLAYRRWRGEGRLRGTSDLERAIVEGAAQRIRPKLMTVLCILLGLVPIMWSTGTGSDVIPSGVRCTTRAPTTSAGASGASSIATDAAR